MKYESSIGESWWQDREIIEDENVLLELISCLKSMFKDFKKWLEEYK